MIGGKFDRALRGEADAELDDPDPLEGFRAQYLNVWPDAGRRRIAPGSPMISEAAWAALASSERVAGPPAAVAIEAWFSHGVSAAFAWPLQGDRVLVDVSAHADVPEALRAAQAAEPAAIIVGKSLLASPAFATIAVEGAGSTSREAVEAFRRLIDEDALRVGIAGPLTDQVTSLRTLPGAEGPRLVSKTRTDAIKAALWAAGRARAATEAPAIF